MESHGTWVLPSFSFSVKETTDSEIINNKLETLRRLGSREYALRIILTMPEWGPRNPLDLAAAETYLSETKPREEPYNGN